MQCGILQCSSNDRETLQKSQTCRIKKLTVALRKNILEKTSMVKVLMSEETSNGES